MVEFRVRVRVCIRFLDIESEREHQVSTQVVEEVAKTQQVEFHEQEEWTDPATRDL